MRLLALLFVIGMLPARAGAEARPPYLDGTLDSPLLGAPTTVDPVFATTLQDLTLVALLFDTLYELGEDAQVRPRLALGLPIASPDGLVVRIELQKEVHFHDGSVLGARDVVSSLNRARKSAPAFLVGIDKVEEDAGVVVLKLTRPMPELARLLALPCASIIKAGEKPRFQVAIGTGPYALSLYNPRRREVKLSRFEQHFAGPPYVGRLTFHWYETADAEARDYEAGTSHFSFRGEVAFAGHRPKYQTRAAESAPTLLVFVGFGRRLGELGRHPEFRRAMTLGIHRSTFRNIGTGELVEPTAYPIRPEAPEELADRVGDARLALSRARRESKAPATLGALEILTDRSRPGDREIAERFAAALFRLGLQAKITELAPRDYATRTSRGDCDFFIGHLAMPDGDPRVELAAAFASAGDDWSETHGGPTGFDLEQASLAFAKRVPLIPLFRRAVRVHYRDNIRGLLLDRGARVRYADLFVFGEPAGSN